MQHPAPGRARLLSLLAVALAATGCTSQTDSATATVDAHTATHLMCQSGLAWADGDAQVQRTLRPAVQKLIGQYQHNANPGVALLALRLDDALNASEATKGVAMAALRRRCRT
ncbi:hypothetical protein BIV57_08090 [Mangrovactinospora gilvigrisea]|uniref:Lipoprotein n=1 Tax=Mangrovactinospora gilvigrisea TaxID=1428644 RepID=A0A1J7CE90_9ACTN|nr:hypothetical protein [Mangrovactinospora gilvigrisea]OIV37986.1 hypothetical protein BIV57_08090 [Mangrovactinospora gilvigrisea]